jgi:UDP-3-O-[3-hydroxymyristoyl] glucosamine N-acyltransferase
VGGDVEAGSVISGSPAYDARQWLRTITALPKLGDLVKTVRALERRVAELEGKNSE